MDLPQYLHHHPRYAPSHPYPADPPNFPNYPHRHHNNHHYNHHHHQQPPPQIQPPPPPPPSLTPTSSYHPLPPPPPPPPPPHPYNPSQPQLPFESEHSRTFHSLHDFPVSSPRVSSRVTLDAERHRHHRLPQFDLPYLEKNPDSWDPSRAYLDFERDRESHKPQFRLESEGSGSGSARFRSEYNEQLLRDQRVVNDEYNNRRRARVEPNSEIAYRELGFVSNQNSNNLNSNNLDFDSKSGGYDGRYDELTRSGGGRRDEVYENTQRWVHHDRQASRELYDPFEVDETNGGRNVSGNREYYGSESGRGSSNNRRKQIQKKSALLRLQMAKPSHKNHSAYFDNSGSGSHRGKGHYEYSDREMDEEERGGSPLELDVSFKSNSLVAKTVGNRNFKRDSVFDRDFSNSQLTKLIEDAVHLDSSVVVEDMTSNSDKDLRLLEEEVTTSGVESWCDIDSQPCSNVTDDSFGKSEVERASKSKVLQRADKSAGSSQMPSLKVSKKKKVAKKVVKKVINPQPLPKNKIDEPGVADSFICRPSAAFGADRGETSSFADPCSNDVHALPVNKKVDGSSLNMLSDEHGTEANSCSKSTGSNSTSKLGSSNHEEFNIDQGPLTVDTSVQGLLMISNFSNNVTDSLRVASCPETDGVIDVSKQICHSGNSLLLDNVIRKESSEAMLSVEGNANSGFLSSEKIMMHDDIMNANGSGHGTETTLDIESGRNVLHQEIIVHDIGTVDAINEKVCKYQFPTSLQIGFVEELPKGISSAESSMTVGLSSSGETLAVCSNSGRGTTWDSDKVCTNYDENIIGKQPSADGASRSFGICATQRSPDITKSVGDSKSVTHKNKKKRKVRSRLDSSRASNTCAEPINVSVNKNSVDTTVSSSLKDASHAEVAVFGVGKLDIGSQRVNDGVCVMHGKSSVDGLCEAKLSTRSDVNCDPNETSPKYIKKGKLSASHLVLTTSQTNDGPTDKSTFYTDAPLKSNDVPTQEEDEVAASSTGLLLATANLMPSQEGSTVFLKDNLAGVLSDAVAAARAAFTNDGMKSEHQGVDSCSIYEESVSDTLFLCPSQLRNEQKEAGTQVMVINNHHLDSMDLESNREENFDIVATDEQVIIHGETALCRVSSEVEPPDLGYKFSCTDMESDYVSVKDTLPFASNRLLLCANDNEVSTTNSNDEGVESVPDTLSDTGSPETSTDVPGVQMRTCSPSVIKISDGKDCGDDQKLDLKSVVEVGCSTSAQNSLSECTKSNLTPHPVTEGGQSVTGKTVAFPLQDIKKTAHGLNLVTAESRLKNQLGQATHRIVPGHSYSVFSTSKKTGSSNHMAKPRTWHRNGNASASSLPASMPFSSTVPPQRILPQKDGKLQSNSYVRKGNSLVRKPVPVAAVPQSSHGFSSAVYRLSSLGIDGLKKNAGSDSRVDVKKPPSLMRTGEMNAPFDRPRPLLPNGAKLSTCDAISLGVRTSSQLAEPLLSGETTSDPMNCLETKDAKIVVNDSPVTSETQENLSGPFNSLENQTELHDGNLAPSNTKNIVYVKRKLNQLVASSSPCDLPVHNADKIQRSSFDGYYKRRKNQLIRTSSEGHAKQAVIMSNDNLNSQVQKVPKIVPSRIYGKKRSQKVIAKTSKTGKNSLVWTPRGTQASNNDGDSFDHQKVLPHLFPWKRARHWRTSMQSQASNFKYSSASTISKKLLLSRRRDTVYTRSTHGFSLRMYKVLSVGGSSLKWSKSIESRSKKANEEATRAVAAVEKKKREHSGAACVGSGSKFRNNISGKRIFRIGSVRYKMDPSRRTLQRISDDGSSSSAVLNPEKDAKRSYVPRRLVIGNDEYVRIGNGNQLIRNPKKRTRILANERVRWSLHTARLRLAKKRKYCQFFTRFGKCNKDDGKCPYIHDPSKIAVCTKFLKGLCSNPNCKLTHKVIPERMQDCSYFLQGLCSNESCPYRHVNVNPKASTCEGFLKGYCADGNECRKKHSYVCPSFEATGTCPQGAKCKLHHPRNRTKGKKRKRTREQKNAWARYFVSKDINFSEPRAVSGKHCAQNGDDIFDDGRAADFISIDDSDEEAGESNDPINEQAASCDSDSSELELDDLDELIKPVRLLDRSLKTNIL